ncbi:hypothetical protein [uncultured Leifsonia sp.]|uniref:hypothetical protein n=1 Tax=uncultured Leifsonia sp. TaxID=340359 RepID=UPI0025D9D179|nr:hypothetical protein [uncultured Leifsonia sp.]
MTDIHPEAEVWELPADWTDGARDLFLSVIEQRPDLAGAELGALEQAAALHSSAERLDEVSVAAGMVALGSMGQTIVHPAVAEARLARVASASILARLVPATAGPMTNSQRGRRAAQARYAK